MKFHLVQPPPAGHVAVELILDDDGVSLRINGEHAAVLIDSDGAAADGIAEAIQEVLASL